MFQPAQNRSLKKGEANVEKKTFYWLLHLLQANGGSGEVCRVKLLLHEQGLAVLEEGGGGGGANIRIFSGIIFFIKKPELNFKHTHTHIGASLVLAICLALSFHSETHARTHFPKFLWFLAGHWCICENAVHIRMSVWTDTQVGGRTTTKSTWIYSTRPLSDGSECKVSCQTQLLNDLELMKPCNISWAR